MNCADLILPEATRTPELTPVQTGALFVKLYEAAGGWVRAANLYYHANQLVPTFPVRCPVCRGGYAGAQFFLLGPERGTLLCEHTGQRHELSEILVALNITMADLDAEIVPENNLRALLAEHRVIRGAPAHDLLDIRCPFHPHLHPEEDFGRINFSVGVFYCEIYLDLGPHDDQPKGNGSLSTLAQLAAKLRSPTT